MLFTKIKSSKWFKKGFLYVFMTGFLFGCAAPLKQAGQALEQPYFSGVETHQANTEGSLWQNTAVMNDLFSNPKARRVGDIVTIKIVESSKASNSASTNTGKDTSVSLGLSKLLGLENKVGTTGFNPFSKIEGAASNKFAGQGATSRSGDLNAHVTAKVVGVMPNGNLAISGSREVVVNNETQLIVLTGVIRPRDISSENVVLSTYISEAKIAYSGSGIVHDNQRKGWLAEILDKISPF